MTTAKKSDFLQTLKSSSEAGFTISTTGESPVFLCLIGESVTPRWSIVIPVKPGGAVRALDAIAVINYPKELVEVIVAEGSRPSSQRNRAAAAAAGEFIYFLDDDSIIKPHVLTRATEHFSDPQVAAVGGPSLTPSSDNLWQKAFGVALSSLVGGGSVRNRYRKSGGPRLTGDNELILCNLAFRREIFLGSGALDERLYPNEENELMDRIRSAGWKLLHDPDLAVTRSQRPSYTAFARQLFTYGRGRGEQTVISGRVTPVSFIPSIFVLYLLLLPFLDNPVYSLPLLCYAVSAVATGLLESAKRRSPWLFPLLLLVIPTLHIAYGSGMFPGLIRPRFRVNGNTPADVTLRWVSI